MSAARQAPPTGADEAGEWTRGSSENICDTAQALTTLTPIRPGRGLALRPFLRVCQYLPHDEFRLLSFIHFVHWTVIGDFPHQTRSGRLSRGIRRRLAQLRRRQSVGGQSERLRYSYILFESNFDGDFAPYIEAFSRVVPERMKLIWGRCFGFPGAQPTRPFLRHINENAYASAHFYSAYPEATTTMVCTALELRRRAAEFDARARDLPPSQFAAEWRDFLRGAQHCL